MKKHNLSISLLLALGISANAFASTPHIAVVGSKPGIVPIYTKSANGAHTLKAAAKKYVQFENIVLSPEAQQYLAAHIDQPLNHKKLLKASQNLPSDKQVGMNGVPVLDQGQHGTCATFASTAALDAVYGHGDYISQLCNLELGAYLEKHNPDYPSGWDGSTNDIILTQIQKYGAINQDYQKKYGCGGLKIYPAMNQRLVGKPMSVSEFTKHSEYLMSTISVNTLLDMDNAFTPHADMEEVLGGVKAALANGHRVAIGTLIDEYVGSNGAAGTYKTYADTWVLTPEIKQHAQQNSINAGHAMVITGYDDNAVVADQDGTEHKGVFTLRNSWGADAGDNGDYYMTYDYFLIMVMEAKEIVSLDSARH